MTTTTTNSLTFAVISTADQKLAKAVVWSMMLRTEETSSIARDRDRFAVQTSYFLAAAAAIRVADGVAGPDDLLSVNGFGSLIADDDVELFAELGELALEDDALEVLGRAKELADREATESADGDDLPF
jgi:hypothetical protein